MKTVLPFVVMSVAAVSGMSTQGTMPGLVSRVDHLVYATPNLDEGVAAVTRLLGVAPTPGGQHPGRGTRNALVSLGPRTYIEIIGPDPDQPAPPLPRPFGIDTLSAPRLVTWAANESDLAGLSARAGAAGLKVGPLADGNRRRLDGLLLTWRYTDPRVVVSDGIVPFFIDWGKTPHPAESAQSGGRLVDLRAEHPEAERVGAELAGLGLSMKVAKSTRPALIATIASPRGRVELR